MATITTETGYQVDKKGQITFMKIIREDGKVSAYQKWDEDNKDFSHFWSINDKDFAQWNWFKTLDDAKQWIQKDTPGDEEIARVMRHFVRNEDAFRKAMELHYDKRYIYYPDFIKKIFEDAFDEDNLPKGDFLDAIHQFIQEGTLNIDGATFNKNDVLMVKWGPGNGNDYQGFDDEEQESPIMLVMKDGETELFPRTAEERWFVKLAFGANYISNRAFHHIKIPE